MEEEGEGQGEETATRSDACRADVNNEIPKGVGICFARSTEESSGASGGSGGCHGSQCEYTFECDCKCVRGRGQKKRESWQVESK
eukprot:4238046-Pleurochrysis_carterae.AAC.1